MTVPDSMPHFFYFTTYRSEYFPCSYYFTWNSDFEFPANQDVLFALNPVSYILISLISNRMILFLLPGIKEMSTALANILQLQVLIIIHEEESSLYAALTHTLNRRMQAAIPGQIKPATQPRQRRV